MANYTQTGATKQIKVGAGKLHSILVSTTSSGTITVYDVEEPGTALLMINTITPAAGSNIIFPSGLYFNKGLYVVIANTLEVTIGWE